MRRFTLILVVVCGAAPRADAACTIALDGEAPAIAQVEAELALFADDRSPCVALQATCHRVGDELAVELNDELGGAAQRVFGTPAGAAAFLVSWSRRPVSSSARADAVSPTALAVPLTAPPITPAVESGERWRPELSVTGILGTTNQAGAVTIAVIQHDHGRRYGLAFRAMSAPSSWDYFDNEYHLAYVGTQAEVMLGREGMVASWLGWRADLIAGPDLITRLAESGDPSVASLGLHAGARAAVVCPLAPGFDLDASVGLDGIWQSSIRRERSPLGSEAELVYPHAEIGLRWTL